MQSGTAFFPVAVLGLAVLTMFSHYMWIWEEFSESPLMLPSSLHIYLSFLKIISLK